MKTKVHTRHARRVGYSRVVYFLFFLRCSVIIAEAWVWDAPVQYYEYMIDRLRKALKTFEILRIDRDFMRKLLRDPDVRDQMLKNVRIDC